MVDAPPERPQKRELAKGETDTALHAQQFETAPTNSRNRCKLMGPAGPGSLGVTPMWNTHPTLEVTFGLAMNLALVLLFAAYPAQWLGLW